MQVACGKATQVCTEQASHAQEHKSTNSHTYTTQQATQLSQHVTTACSPMYGYVHWIRLCIYHGRMSMCWENRLGTTAELLCIAYVAARLEPIQKRLGAQNQYMAEAHPSDDLV